MELLLNEKSLDGQFESLDAFCETLPVMSRNLKALRELGITLWKHNALYARKITEDITLFDMNNRKGVVHPTQRDKVTKFKRELSSLTNVPPFWNDELEIKRDSLEEAAMRGTDVLSFKHPKYCDVVLDVECESGVLPVKSAVTTKYLLDLIWHRGEVDVFPYMRMRYGTGRIVLDYLGDEVECVADLQKDELEELIVALDRFDETKSWEEILRDNFFYYKSYKPSSNKKNYFYTTRFRDKNIDKFRCGKHSQVRCFGYREGDKFNVLLIERDHSVSDSG